MDKMGSSVRSGNLGHPATSRDGAPIELTCLLKKCLSHVLFWIEHYEYPYNSVYEGSKELSFVDWAQLI